MPSMDFIYCKITSEPTMHTLDANLRRRPLVWVQNGCSGRSYRVEILSEPSEVNLSATAIG